MVGIRSVADYSPFGVELDGRTQSGAGYRYSFQGQEKDEEIKGVGNSINYKYRMHDPRVGRFFAVDPLSVWYPWNSTYAFSENRVVDAIEMEGLEKHVVTGKARVSNDKPVPTAEEISEFQRSYREGMSYVKSLENQGKTDEALLEKRELFLQFADESKNQGWVWAAEMLEHYIIGQGNKKRFDSEYVKKYAITQAAVDENNQRFFTYSGGGDYENVGEFAKTLGEGESKSYNDYYDNLVENFTIGGRGEISDANTEAHYALGNFTLRSVADLNVTKKGDKYYITGNIKHVAGDIYDWHANGGKVEIYGVTIYDYDLADLKNVNANSYIAISTVWSSKIKDGSYFTIDKDGNIDYSNVTIETE